jgi:peptidoglycan/xylan/chitin deacetylase (PgdA/CDA1 family)
LCVARTRSKWSATIAGRRLAAPVTLVGRRGVSVTVPLAALGLPAGALQWSVQAREAGCALGDIACSDRLPTRGHLRDQLWRAVATGCSRVGAGQVRSGPTSRRVVAFTFDDGPSPYTAQMRVILEREHGVATFFELGRSLAGQQEAARALIADGDEIGDHSWDHANLGGGGPGATSEISRTGSAIQSATGFTPCTFRPPYGSTGSDLVSRANALGMTSVLWTVDTNDYLMPGAAAIERSVLAGVAPGGIILMHDGGGPRGDSVAALAAVLPVLRRRGYRFVTVSQLLGNTTTYGLVRPS